MAITLMKRSTESRLYVFDFGFLPEIVAGDTIASVTSVTFTQPPSSSALTLGSTSIVNPPNPPVGSGATLAGVQLRISGGTSGYSYAGTATAVTAQGNTLVCLGVLKIIDTDN